MNIGGRGVGGSGAPTWRCASSANQSSTSSTKRSSRSRRLSYVIRRLRVSRLKTNWISSWWTYCGRSSNHCALATAARWVLATSGLRAASYAASAAGTPSSRRSADTSSVASSTASFVAEPIEKCAVCAASPSSTMLSWNQRSTFSVGKLSHLELFTSS